MGSDPGAASTMRWMRSHTELMHVKSTGFSMPTYRGSSIVIHTCVYRKPYRS
jgi:hypothetical protein